MPTKPASKAPAKSAAKPATKPADDVVESELTPSEQVDAKIAAEELRKELLADMPALRPAHRFRLAHRNAFHNLSLEAMKSGAFARDDMEYDLTKPEDIEAFQKLQSFVASIDTWAESIAEDVDAYTLWSEGKTEEHFMALFVEYQEALGE